MAALANTKGVRHLVGLQARCDPALLRLQELLRENYLGDVLACNMTMFLPGLLQRGLERAWMADRDQGANTLRNCHEITCSLLHAQLYLMGDS